MKLKKLLPWWAKILAKLALARVAFSYKFWKRIGVFVHGRMNAPEYAYRIFSTHFKLCGPPAGFVALELGPGDSLSTALMVKSVGGSRSILVDAGQFAASDMAPYLALSEFLKGNGLSAPELVATSTVTDLLKACHAKYLTHGLSSLREIPDECIDFAFSNAVLEHVRRDELKATMMELRRVLKKGCYSSHEVDLRDHLAESLNNLRFSTKIWESRLFQSSGFYTNRVRFGEMLRIFEACGFSVEVIEKRTWSTLPLPRTKLHFDFRDLEEDDLRVATFVVRLKAI